MRIDRRWGSHRADKKTIGLCLFVVLALASLVFVVNSIVDERTACEKKHCTQPGFEPRMLRDYDCICVEIPK
jgi:hypothetical protein